MLSQTLLLVIIVLLIVGVVFALVPNIDGRIKTAVFAILAVLLILALLNAFGLLPMAFHRPW